MRLTPREQDALMVYVAADVARRRRNRGLKLNYPEAVAIIADTIIEAARDGRSVTEAAEEGRRVLGRDDVLPGIAELLPSVQVEATFPDGTKLVTSHNPIAEVDSHNSNYLIEEGEIELNAGRRVHTLLVANTGDRPIQVGSHAHFFEVNRALRFDREQSFGMRLDIPSGTAVRFEPGEEREVPLVALGGNGLAFGMNALTEGKVDDSAVRAAALARARDRGFMPGGPP